MTITFGEASGGTGNLTFAGSGNLNIGSGVTRTLNVLNTTSMGQALVGSANLIKTGAGTLILSANNTYTGATTINAGILQIGNGGTSGALSISSTITNNATLVFNRSDSLVQGTHFSGNAITGTGSVIKNGAGNLTLSAANTYNGATTVNSGTLQASTANALANTSQVVLNNGGSFLVTAANAVNDSAPINLNGGRMALSGNFNETVGLLTLSANSTIDFSGFGGTLRFGGIGSWATGATLAIWNWSGTTQYGTQINNYANPSNLVFSNNSTLTSNLANISFYSDSGNSFVGNGFEATGFSGGGSEIIAVPEPETLLYAIALLAGSFVQYLRRRSKQKFVGLDSPLTQDLTALQLRWPLSLLRPPTLSRRDLALRLIKPCAEHRSVI